MYNGNDHSNHASNGGNRNHAGNCSWGVSQRLGFWRVKGSDFEKGVWCLGVFHEEGVCKSRELDLASDDSRATLSEDLSDLALAIML